MTVSVRQYTNPPTVESSAVTAIAAALPASPVSGNILIYAAIIDKAAGTRTVPTDFTSRSSGSNANVSGMVATKTSNGSESGSISGSWATANGAKAAILEIQGSGGSTVSFDAATALTYQGTASAGITTASLATGANARYVLAFIGKDSAKATSGTADPVGSFDNGFSILFEDWRVPTSNGEVAFIVGYKAVSGGTTESTTFTHDGATDQWVAALISINETGGGGGGFKSAYTRNSNGVIQ